MARNSIKGEVVLKSEDNNVKTSATAADVSNAEAEAEAADENKAEGNDAAAIKYSMADALGALAIVTETTKTAAETMTVLAVIAITRGASKALVTETIQNAATARGYKEGNHRQVAGTSFSLAKYAVQNCKNMTAALAVATLEEAQALVAERIALVLDGSPWRALWDIALMLDPERRAAKEKRDADKADADRLKAEAEAEAARLKAEAEAVQPDNALSQQETAATSDEDTLAAVLAWLDTCPAEMRDAISAKIDALDKAAAPVEEPVRAVA